MFRSSEVKQQARTTDICLDGDDNYEFTGATLKITTTTTIENMENEINDNKYNKINYMENNDKPAVLSGSDIISPISTNLNSNESTPKITKEDRTSREISTIDVKSNIGSPRHFFCFRRGLFEQAVNDCINILLKSSNDTELQGSWLLTEITHWDHEKEKVIILTSKTLLVVKYDFIALRVLEHYKITLNKIDKIVKGKLTYPTSSLVPERNDLGVRLMWNKGQPLSASTSWNPFAKDIPWKTFTNHPLHGYDDSTYNTAPNLQDDLNQNRLIYSIDNFHYALIRLFTNDNIDNANINHNSTFDDEPILLQNYAGLSAVFHNRNNLGFFKVRGKFSF